MVKDTFLPVGLGGKMKKSLRYAGETEYVDEIHTDLLIYDDEHCSPRRPMDYCVVIDIETGIAYTGTYDYVTEVPFIVEVEHFLS